MLSLDDALDGKPGKFLFGCQEILYDVGPTEDYSVYHIDHPHWGWR